MGDRSSSKTKFKLAILSIAAIASIALLSFFTFKDYLTDIDDWLARLGYWGIPAFIGIYLSATLLGLPAVFLFVAAGSLFGFNKGFLLVSFADTLSASACYGLGRTVGRKRIARWLTRRPEFRQIDRAIAKKGWKIVFLTRLSPIFPSNILNYGFSLTKIDFWHYLFFTWLGMLPVIGLYVYLGSMGINLIQGNQSLASISLSAVGIVATIAALFYTTRVTRKALALESSTSQRLRQNTR